MESSRPSLLPIRKLFPHLPNAAFNSLASKQVDVLIGLNMSELAPVGGLGTDRVGGLTALRSAFGCGWVIGGHSDLIRSTPASIYSAAASLKIAKLQVIPDRSCTPEFWEAEGMGVLPPPRCDSCLSCLRSGACSDKNHTHSVKKQAELELIQSKMELKNGEVWCQYPFIKDPASLSYNRASAVKVAERVERGLIKDGLYATYNEQIKSQLDRGVAVKLSEDEIASWSGPCQYVSHHPVLKDSVTTPVRVVSNSSFNNAGNSLNKCIASGPNSLNPMIDVMLRFRCWPIAVQFDLAKAYNTLRTGLVERHMRRFVWRFDPSTPWEDYALDRVHFGDACAATQLEVAKNMIAQHGSYIDPVASQRIQDDVYVDDGLTGGTKEQVARFVGTKNHEGLYNGTFSRIFALGNFKVKAFSVSGQTATAESDLMGNKVLGYNYNVERDMLAVSFPINLSQKKRSIRSDRNLTLEDIPGLWSRTLTKRSLLGVTNSFRDFLGIAAPFIIKFKVLMRDLFLLDEPLSWDQEVPDSCKSDWIHLIAEALEFNTLDFRRCTQPLNAVPDLGPTLVGFSDYGKYGYDARIYMRWLSDFEIETYVSRLLLCKARVPPLKGLTVPRGELTALTLQSRLMVLVVKALQKLDYPPTNAYMLADSKCAISSVHTNRTLKPYFQNRTAEVKENLEVIRNYCALDDICYVASNLNPSDISTKATCTLSELGPDSYHQTGPYFLALPRAEWPVVSYFTPCEIPEDELRVRDKFVFSAALRSNFCHTDTYPNNPWMVIENLLHYSNNLEKVIRIIARYLRGLEAGIRKNTSMTIDNPVAYTIIAATPTRSELKTAERLLLLHGMVHTNEALVDGKLTTLLPFKDGKLIVTRGRLGEQSLEKLLGVSCLPILMPYSRVAYLYMVWAHCGEFGLIHRGLVSTLARSRRKVWIVKARSLAKKVVRECARCAKDRKCMLMQQMSEIKDEQTTMAPPWTHIALDFAGPVLVKNEVNKRSKMKCWILVYSCRATKAVCLLATPGYSTADFLNKHAEFVYRKGRPSSVVSDRGTQLVAGSIALSNKDMPINKVDWKTVVSENSATDWTFAPIGGQHRNGLSESTVKVLKKSLDLSVNKGADLTYSELVTLLAKVSYSINSRPLSLANTCPSRLV